MGLQVTLEVAFPQQYHFHLTWEGEEDSLYKVMIRLITYGFSKSVCIIHSNEMKITFSSYATKESLMDSFLRLGLRVKLVA